MSAIFKSSFGVVDSSLPLIITAGIWVCAIPYVLALIYVKKLGHQLAIKQPFSSRIPSLLEKISWCAFSEIVIFVLVQIVWIVFFDLYLYALTVIPMIVVAFVSLTIGVGALVFKKLFEQAIVMKEEHDFTI